MRTSMTDKEKDSSSAAVKRPQQPKEILEDSGWTEAMPHSERLTRGQCAAAATERAAPHTWI